MAAATSPAPPVCATPVSPIKQLTGTLLALLLLMAIVVGVYLAYQAHGKDQSQLLLGETIFVKNGDENSGAIIEFFGRYGVLPGTEDATIVVVMTRCKNKPEYATIYDNFGNIRMVKNIKPWDAFIDTAISRVVKPMVREKKLRAILEARKAKEQQITIEP